MTFNRCRKITGVNTVYASSAGLRPGRYLVVCELVSDFAGLPTVVGLVVSYRGKLCRCWMS